MSAVTHDPLMGDDAVLRCDKDRKSELKVAIIHDWLTLRGGAEACLAQFIEIFPQADIYTIVDFLPEDEREFLGNRKVKTSFIQKLPYAKKIYRIYLPLMPMAIEQFDVTNYDLVLSSSASVAKGIITGPRQIHIAYTHSPIRYAWDLQHQYLAEAKLEKGLKSLFARIILHYMRMWDTRTASGVDCFVANSNFVSRRILKAYGRKAEVIYPPVNLEKFELSTHKEEFYVTVSRLVPYKRIPLIVEAFRNMPTRRLVVIGDGPEMNAVRAAAGPNVTIMGKQPDDVVVSHLQRARAFIFAAEEDFGIAPVEAQACGTPVIAYGQGGSLETVIGSGPGQTGVFFPDQTTDDIMSAVEQFEGLQKSIDPESCRRNAERFSTADFKRSMLKLIYRYFNE